MDDTPGRVKDVANDVSGTGDADERTRQIRSEIEETRVELTETIDAIQEKLKPRNIVANATDRVKSAAAERVREMADTASQTAHQAMDYTRDAASGMKDRLRENSFPLALIGLGAAWLLARGTSQRRRSYNSTRRDELDYGREYASGWTRDEELYGDTGEYGFVAKIRNNPIPAALAGVGLTWLAFSGSERGGREYTTRWDEGSRERNPMDSTNQIASRTRDYVSDATDSMRRMARRRRSQFQHMVQDNPLLVGAGALMLGATFGLAVPETEKENELMGEARDNVVGRAREMARDAANQVQDAAGAVADAAGKIVEKSQQ